MQCLIKSFAIQRYGSFYWFIEDIINFEKKCIARRHLLQTHRGEDEA